MPPRKPDGALGAQVEEVAVRRPDPVAERTVDEEHPERDEGHPTPEGDPLRHGPGDEGRRDDGEPAPEHGEGASPGHARRQDGVVDAAQEHQAAAPTDEATQGVGSETQRVASHHGPQDAHHGHGREGVHHRAQHVLRAHQAAVEHRQARTMSSTRVVEVSIQAVAPESFAGVAPWAAKGRPAPSTRGRESARFQVIGSSGKG